MKFHMVLPLLLSLLACSTQGSKQQAINSGDSNRCETVTTSRTWKYCVSESLSSNKTEVLYYFHGGGGSELSWDDSNNYTAEIKKYWNSNGHHPPVVVTVSFGDIWLLAQKNSSEQSGLYEVFKIEVIPYIESKVLGQKPVTRMLLGESMGSYNAAVLALRNPKMFRRAALLCPALDLFLPTSERDIENYAKQTGASLSYAKNAAQIASKFFDSPEAAQSNSPMFLINQSRTVDLPLYVSCGRQDQYGFYFGAEKFVQIAQSKNANVVWMPLEGKHCTADPDSVAKFLSQ